MRGYTLPELLVAILIATVLAAAGVIFFAGAAHTSRLRGAELAVQAAAGRLVVFGENHDDGYATLTPALASALAGRAVTQTSTNTALYMSTPTPQGVTVGECTPAYFTSGGQLCAQAQLHAHPQGDAVGPYTLLCPSECPVSYTGPLSAADGWPPDPKR
jgi:prepilin-type N-terminal cleavage/methylation domain-containing protein